jgi:hypothetical protein
MKSGTLSVGGENRSWLDGTLDIEPRAMNYFGKPAYAGFWWYDERRREGLDLSIIRVCHTDVLHLWPYEHTESFVLLPRPLIGGPSEL